MTDLEYYKSTVPNVTLEDSPRFTDVINSDTFAKIYGKTPDIVLEKEPDIEEYKHLDIFGANKEEIDLLNNGAYTSLMPDIDFEGVDFITKLKEAAEQENFYAQNILGICHFAGHKCPVNPQLGMDYFERATENNYTVAMRNLAIALENVDAQRSLELYKRSAKLGDKVAKINLEYMEHKVNQKNSIDRVLSLKDKVPDKEPEHNNKEKERDAR